MRRPTPGERQRIADAVHAAEGGTAGEIVTIVAGHSDTYHDIALLWTILAMLLVPALFAALPQLPTLLLAPLTGGWDEPTITDIILVMMGAMVLLGGVVWLLCRAPSIRMALTPKPTRRRRVRRRALDLFRVGTEGRTTGKTGILLYLSVGERMAELVADEAIHARVADTEWGDAMLALIAEVRHERIADGMIAAVGKIGEILVAHLPHMGDNANELPDRLIEL